MLDKVVGDTIINYTHALDKADMHYQSVQRAGAITNAIDMMDI